MMSDNLRIEARVKARNRANEEANRLQALLIPFFAPYVGQKILKADGTLLQKIKDKMPALEDAQVPGRHIYRQTSDYTLGWTVKTNEMDSEHTCTYAETTAYIGDLRNGVLEAIAKGHTHRTDWTVAEVQAVREQIRAAENALSEARSKLGPFDMYDH